MANTLTTLEKATVDDATNHALPAGSFSLVSDTPTVATVNTDGGFWYCMAGRRRTPVLAVTGTRAR